MVGFASRHDSVLIATAIVLFSGAAGVASAAAQVDTARADSLFGASSWAAAAAAYEDVVQEAPDDGRAWFRLGFAQHQNGQYAAAIAALEKANALEFTPQRVRVRLAMTYAAAGDTDAAFEWLHAAVEAGFNNLGMLRTHPGFEALRNLDGFDGVLRAAEAAHPCSRDDCRQFDFWVGDWDVFNPAGTQVGENSIRRVENGCALTESWTGAGGGTGSSINFYHPGRGKWVQTWYNGSGGIIELEGELRDGAMSMQGTNYSADGSHQLIRGTWTPLPDGRVRQFFEQSRDLGKTWYVWFDGFYVRRDTDTAAN